MSATSERETELLAEMKDLGWSDPIEAVKAYWDEARPATKSAFQRGERVSWLVNARYLRAIGPLHAVPEIALMVRAEYWMEKAYENGEPAYRIMGRIAGIPQSVVQLELTIAK